MVELDKKKNLRIINVFIINPVENMNVYTKCYWNPSNSCEDILLKTKTANLTLVADEKSEDHRNHEDSSSGNHKWLYQI